MQYAFDHCLLSTSTRELRVDGLLVAVEPKVFDIIRHLLENRDRVVSKDELTEVIWDRRFITDASLSTALKSARKAVGDDGEAQKIIKTVRGRGFRFVAEVTVPMEERSLGHAPIPPKEEQASPSLAPAHGAGRPSIAVMRFVAIGEQPQAAAMADALPAELISGLSRMHWLHVIARGSTFHFDPKSFDTDAVSQRLGVNYIMTGMIETQSPKVVVSLEAQSAVKGTLVWSERFAFDAGEINRVRTEIVAAAIAAIETSIPQFEASNTRILTPDQFDAWSHFHIGLTHAFKFKSSGNQRAAWHFGKALELDPEFGRAHAAMSFIHWQNAFMRMEGARQDHMDMAYAEASRALEIDPNDPFGSFCMGRALWFSEDVDASVAWLDRGLAVNPNYAHCHYTKGMILNMNGSYADAHTATSHAMALSPLDPLYYGMLANQTLNEIAQDNLTAAMTLAEKAVHSPGTYHYPILWAAIAAELNGNRDTMERWRDRALLDWPQASADAFLQTFPIKDPTLLKTITGSLRRMGIE
jgi:TolB-like protein/Tfp pilus assembly protein PilF